MGKIQEIFIKIQLNFFNEHTLAEFILLPTCVFMTNISVCLHEIRFLLTFSQKFQEICLRKIWQIYKNDSVRPDVNFYSLFAPNSHPV